MNHLSEGLRDLTRAGLQEYGIALGLGLEIAEKSEGAWCKLASKT